MTLAFGGVAYAGYNVAVIASSPSDQWHACVSNTGVVRASTMRLNSYPASCPRPTDTVRSWNASGPTGASGLNGATGATGLSGATGATGPSGVVVTPDPQSPGAIAASISAGGSISCLLLIDHTIKCLGNNQYGQLGNGSTDTQSLVPVIVTGINNATSVSSGEAHSCALLIDNTIKCWGYNSNGQLGNGSAGGFSRVPLAVTGINNAISISSGAYHSCALLIDHTVKCWGSNNYWQLGNASASINTNWPVPQAVTGLDNATSISAGANHSCALLIDNTIICWGYNGNGGLGNSNASSVQSYQLWVVTGIDNATAINAGPDHSCALLIDNTIKCWGSSNVGQLGKAAYWGYSSSSVPLSVDEISTAVAISTGYQYSCALLLDNTIKCWGYNSNGEIGNGITGNVWSPVAVSGIDSATAISSAVGSTNCALLVDNTIKCWGSNASGQLENGTVGGFSRIPLPLSYR